MKKFYSIIFFLAIFSSHLADAAGTKLSTMECWTTCSISNCRANAQLAQQCMADCPEASVKNCKTAFEASLLKQPTDSKNQGPVPGYTAKLNLLGCYEKCTEKACGLDPDLAKHCVADCTPSTVAKCKTAAEKAQAMTPASKPRSKMNPAECLAQCNASDCYVNKPLATQCIADCKPELVKNCKQAAAESPSAAQPHDRTNAAASRADANDNLNRLQRMQGKTAQLKNDSRSFADAAAALRKSQE